MANRWFDSTSEGNILVMKIIRNNIIPFKGFAAINLFGVLFVRKDIQITPVMINHESIHTAQMKEMLYVFFYICYVLEWVVNLICYGFNHTAYRMISFEREAYDHQRESWYVYGRKHFAQWRK